ncbi:hypothetical protein BDV95DRAFT_651916 [Massariosphaeria phaeospora]|uniref:Uncharacterized protein n=1 Tax=Massariosphaeria phaeospora TaxID=100035 RepID=A0A7C8M229_9PLEO|nr:hypothetical protein BDV95DRAFT_651916 [Massariosphaeria phaeospora]
MAQMPSAPNEYEQMKAILEDYEQIYDVASCHLTVSYMPMSSITMHYVPMTEGVPIPDTIYTIHVDHARCADVSRELPKTLDEALPAGTPPYLARAVQKLNLCDHALEVMKDAIAEKLREIGARVEWLRLIPLPRFIVHSSDEPPQVYTHSVFAITSASGAQYIADFTIEQFGFDRSMWFMTCSDYMEQCSEDGNWWLHTEEDQLEMDSMRPPSDVQDEAAVKGIVDGLCARLNWDELYSMAGEDRIEYIRGQATTVFEAEIKYSSLARSNAMVFTCTDRHVGRLDGQISKC